MRKNLLKIGQIFGVFALACTGNLWSQTQTFEFTGGIQTFTVPCGVDSVYIEAWGAQGGTGDVGASVNGGPGGLGGYAGGAISVAEGDVINIFVGGTGSTPMGGFNGGANGGSTNAGGGGGATDIRIGGTSEAERVLTAGGGGGGGRGGCEGSSGPSGVGGDGGSGGGGVGVNGADSPTSGGTAGGGKGGNFGAIPGGSGPAGDGCGGFLGSSGSSTTSGSGATGGAGQSCCCFGNPSVPGGGGGGGGQIGGGGGGGGSAGTVGCSGNDKGAGGGGGGGTNYFGGALAGVDSLGVHTGDGVVIISWADATPGVPTITAPTSICANTNTTITCSADANATTYNWIVGGGLTIVSGQGTTTIVVSGNGVSGSVSVEGSNACATGMLSPATVITIIAAPMVGVNASASAVCLGDTITLSGTGAVSYTWDQGVTDGVAFVPGNSATYIVTGTDGNGCTGTATFDVQVNIPAVVSMSASPAGIVCQGDMVTLTGSPAGGTLSITSGTGGSLVGNDFSSASFGNFVLQYDYTDANGCSAFDTINIEVGCQGIEINAANSPVSIYPNPVQGSFQLSSTSMLNGKVELYDGTGKRVLTTELSNVTKKQIEVTGLAPGIYNVRILNGAEQFTGKITIIK